MSEDTNNTQAGKPAEAPLKEWGTVERNGVTLVFHETRYKKGELSKPKEGNPNYPVVYPFPDGLENFPLAQLIQFIGEDNVKELLLPKFQQVAQGWAWESQPTDDVKDKAGNVVDEIVVGPVDREKFLQCVKEFSVISESMGDLKDKQDALALKLPTIKDPVELQKQINILVNITNAIHKKKRTRTPKGEVASVEAGS